MSAATTYINGLLYDARCFRCLPEATHFEIQTYILSVIAGGSTDPAVLVNQARGLAALSWDSLTEIKVYLLAVEAGFDPDPNNLVAGAKCFSCIPQGMFTEVQTYLLSQDPAGPGITEANALAHAAKAFQSLDPYDLLQIQVMLIAQIGGFAVDPNALIQAAKCMKCLPQPTLITVWIATLDFLEPIPPDSPRVPLPPPDPPRPPHGGPPPIRGGGVRGCTDILSDLTPVITAHYVAGAITTIDILIPVTCCKKSSFELFGSNAADMSGAVLITGGSNPNKTVNWTMTGIDVSLAGFQYYAAQSVCVGGLTSPFSNIVLSVDGSTIANDWANRVVVNGGPMPSQNSINACETFVEALMLAGIWSKMVAVNMVAPDSLTAALTPLVKNAGFDPWTINVFDSLTVNGIKCAVGWIDTGVNPSTNPFPAFSYGLVAYNYDPFSAQGQYSIGANVAAYYALGHTNAGQWELDLTFPDLQLFVAGAVNWAGYSSGQRISNNDLKCYRANSVTPWAQVGSDATVVIDRRAQCNCKIFALAISSNNFATATTVMRHSFFAITQGLTATEDHALYDAVQALRTAFGGGFV